ncbi:MAG: XRE family transcriptional regulator [Oceanicaulis sp.]
MVSDMMRAERDRLNRALNAYDTAKNSGDASALKSLVAGEPGVMLIVARIANGLSQKDLAWRLGVKEQQIQRWEADRYGQISLRNFQRISKLLGVRVRADMPDSREFRGLDHVIDDVSKPSIKKILKHGREAGWFDDGTDEDRLRAFIAENRIDFGSPSLLRTGLNVIDHSDDIMLHAWRARVAERARTEFAKIPDSFDPLSLGWIPELAKQSIHADGPQRASEMLRDHGIALIAERQIPGLAIDGAAFMLEDRPVIGLTLRTDTLDNFWFTLMHELAHVTLHYATGLQTGFFDQTDKDVSVDEQEEEANLFASNILIPDEMWRKSTARIAKSPEVIEKFAAKIQIHPAIVFGRIRKERAATDPKAWALFADRIGRNVVRKQLLGSNFGA